MQNIFSEKAAQVSASESMFLLSSPRRRGSRNTIKQDSRLRGNGRCFKTFSKKQGFTLVEIMIVVAIIGIITAIAIPALLRGRLNANESAAKANLRTFSSAAEAYRSAQAAPSYPADIGNLTTATPAYLDTTWGAAATTTKSGYVATYAFGGAAQYAIYAEPSQAGITGNNSFCIDETGVAWVSDTSSGAFTGSPCSGGAGAITLQ